MMRDGKKHLFLFFPPLAVALMLFVSCASAPPKKQQEQDIPPVAVEETKPRMISQKLSAEEQDRLSFEVFEEILNLTSDKPRAEILPQMLEAYRKIASLYPDAHLAQESYLQMVNIYLNDFTPPKTDMAEDAYREYMKLYADSPFRAVIEDKLVRFYYATDAWDKLLWITRPAIAKYIKEGTLEGPFFLFLYSEAKLNTGVGTEAEKGYRTIIELFPQSTEAKVSQKRLIEINKQ